MTAQFQQADTNSAASPSPADATTVHNETEILSLFPRTLLRGQLNSELLADLLCLASEVATTPEASPDASGKLAGQLSQQRELPLAHRATRALGQEVILPACERWIRHVIDQQPPQGRGPWTPGRYGLRLIDLWLNVQRAGDYNPTHTHGGSFSGVLFLKVPPQITSERFDGQLCFHGPEEWQIQAFRTGMAHYVLPIPGEYYVFPAWQPHSVAPFRGEGERWSVAFNVVAVPQPVAPQPPGAPAAPVNVSLSSARQRPGGFG
ncbi:MAG: hypothetical protein RLZZ117_861 [Cyanobacteriota bacterium]|jgi:hypothetical protein